MPIRNTAPPDDPGPGLPPLLARSAVAAAAWTGFGAAALGAFVTVAIALALWIPDSTATGTSSATVHAGLLTFLAAQHGGVRLSGVDIGFIPLGLPLLAVGLCWRSSRVLWALPVVGRAPRPRRLVRLAAVQVAAYVASCAVLVPFAVIGTSRVPVGAAVVGALGVGLVGFGAAALVMTRLGPALWTGLPKVARTAIRAGVGAFGVYVAGGALLVAVITAARVGRYVELARGLGTGVAGVPVAALDTLAAPNVVLAAAAYLIGPGFVVGRHATYSLLGSHPGAVPAFPPLSALPARSTTPVATLLFAAVVVLGAGVVAGLLVRRRTRSAAWRSMLLAAAASGAVVGGLLAITSALAGGRMGAHELSAVGASPWQVAVVAAIEVGVGAVLTTTLARLIIRRPRELAPAAVRLEEMIGSRAATDSAAAAGESVDKSNDEPVAEPAEERPEEVEVPARAGAADPNAPTVILPLVAVHEESAAS